MRKIQHTVSAPRRICESRTLGVNVHSSLALTPDGIPFGTASSNAPANVQLIHIADREGDIYELYALAEQTGEKYIVRATTHNRLTTDGTKILDVLRSTSWAGVDKMTIPANHKSKTKEREAILTVRYRTFSIKKPARFNPNKELANSLDLTLISLTEESPPDGVEPVE